MGEGINRRELLKRGAIAGGVLWATPVVQAISMVRSTAAATSRACSVEVVSLIFYPCPCPDPELGLPPGQVYWANGYLGFINTGTELIESPSFNIWIGATLEEARARTTIFEEGLRPLGDIGLPPGEFHDVIVPGGDPGPYPAFFVIEAHANCTPDPGGPPPDPTAPPGTVSVFEIGPFTCPGDQNGDCDPYAEPPYWVLS